MGIELIHVTARRSLLEKLGGGHEPETNARSIGELFVRIFEENTGGPDRRAEYLVQGTLYPDVIESWRQRRHGLGHQEPITTSAALPEDMTLQLVEPLRTLFKDEVRKLGHELGLPDEIVLRQPFPGPGLGVRIVGEVTPERVAILQHADAHRARRDRQGGPGTRLWQAFAVLADIRSVGVMGDERTYGHPIIIRAVTSDDAMTADWARLPLRPARDDVEPHHQRSGRHQLAWPVRHHLEAARHHRVGIGEWEQVGTCNRQSEVVPP